MSSDVNRIPEAKLIERAMMIIATFIVPIMMIDLRK